MQSHGELTLEWKDDVLMIYPQGPFNEEGVVEVIDTIKNAVLIRNNQNWSRLEVWEENTLGSPAVMNSVKEYYRWCTEHGCIAAAIVVKNSVQRSYIEKYFSGNIAVFNSKKEAIDWLMEYSNT